MNFRIKLMISCAYTLVLAGCMPGLDHTQKPFKNSLMMQAAQETLEQNMNLKDKIDLSEIAFIEPASAITDANLEAVQKFFPLERSFPALSPVPYHASDDVARFNNLKAAIYGDKKIIWAVRGGYGSARLFDELSLLTPPLQQKVLVGYSDVTFLHLFFNQWGWKTLHGAMPKDLSNKEVNLKNFTDLGEVLKHKKGTLAYNAMKCLNPQVLQESPVDGELLGGNLTLLANSMGTPWQLQGKNKIIFIEEVGSKGYVIDRNLTHLKQAGVFKEAKAVLLGSFIDGDENTPFALERFAAEMPCPVFQLDTFGHGKDNFPLPFGFVSRITKQRDGHTLLINYDFE